MSALRVDRDLADGSSSYALDPDTHEALREHVIAWDKEQSGERSDRLFVWDDGAPLTAESVGVLFRRHSYWAEVPIVALRALRQAYVVAALESGISPSVINERLGLAGALLGVTRIPPVEPDDPAPGNEAGVRHGA